MQTPTYDIRAFHWHNKTRTFSQDAWNLEWMDGEYHIAAFPNMKEPFYIKNYKTGEHRLFVYVHTVGDDWIFENADDNITCIIGTDPF